jgi:hypothetical protein
LEPRYEPKPRTSCRRQPLCGAERVLSASAFVPLAPRSRGDLRTLCRPPPGACGRLHDSGDEYALHAGRVASLLVRGNGILLLGGLVAALGACAWWKRRRQAAIAELPHACACARPLSAVRASGTRQVRFTRRTSVPAACRGARTLPQWRPSRRACPGTMRGR